jgi:hypothetical protein
MFHLTQAGEENQALDSVQHSERNEKKEGKTTTSSSTTQNVLSTVTTKKTATEEVILTFEKKDIRISCNRQTVSHMEVLNVEEQLVQVFCEQVL